MATLYKVTITTVSPFCAYPEEEIEKIFEDFMKTYKHPVTELGFESTIVIAQRDPSEVMDHVEEGYSEKQFDLYLKILIAIVLNLGLLYLVFCIRLILNGNY